MARILVVDDDSDILKMLEQVLAAAGHVVIAAEDVLRAVELLNYLEFDMLISDINMPVHSGFDLVQTVRKNPHLKNMSIAMLTGLRERKDIDRAIKAGVDDYIVKPIDPMILLQKVASLFEKRPPQKYPEIDLTDQPDLAKGSVQVSVKLVAVSEVSVQALCEVPIKLGQVIDINAEFFKTLGHAPPPMKVLSCEKDNVSGQWKLQLIYLGAREAFLQKVRRWLHTHGGSNRSAA